MNIPAITFLSALAVSSQAAKITFYEHSNFAGKQLTLDYEGLNCYNLPSEWNDQASSISTHDNCFLVFEHADCKGRMERIAPGTRSHGHLGDLDFNDMITSYRQCSPSENTCRQVNVQVDTSKATDLNDLGEKMKRTIEEWYPFVCRLLWSPSLKEVGTIYLKLEPQDGGVAGAGGNQITGNANYYRRNPNDLGSMIHEMAHIVQHYPMNCDWLTEGIADYPRRWYYEEKREGKPSKDETYKSKPVYFLAWVDERWPNTIYTINKECRDKTFKEDLWTKLTGKTPQQLWDQMMRE